MAESKNSFNVLRKLEVGDESYNYFALDAVSDMEKLLYSLRVLDESLLHNEDGANITEEHIKTVANRVPSVDPSIEVQFTPARIIMQNFIGVARVVDLATIREVVKILGGDPDQASSLSPVEIVIDHSVIIEAFSSGDALAKGVEIEHQHNDKCYKLLCWDTGVSSNFRAVPSGTGIVHQVNIEYLARVIFENSGPVCPNTCVDTDSRTTMQNGLGIPGWGVGGIEAKAVMPGQPTSILIPRVAGFKLIGDTQPGVTATGAVLTVTDMLYRHGVVNKFVEFYGAGVSKLPLANRMTIDNTSPEFSSTATILPIDDETVKYLALTDRDKETLERVEAYTKAQGMWLDESTPEAEYSKHLELDLFAVISSIVGSKHPQDRIELVSAREQFRKDLHNYSDDKIKGVVKTSAPTSEPTTDYNESHGGHGESAANGAEGHLSSPTTVASPNSGKYTLDHGMVAIASIASCTDVSNPPVMIGAGLLARKAAKKGLKTKPWVKTICTPGPQVVNGCFKRVDLWKDLEALGFYLPGFGCTTCIGNSGSLSAETSSTINGAGLAATAVLPDNRNFEGRISPNVKMSYLVSPILAIVYSAADTMDFDFETDTLSQDAGGNDIFLRNIWPSTEKIGVIIETFIPFELYDKGYKDVFTGDERWQNLPTPEGKTSAWDDKPSYIRKAPYFDEMEMEPALTFDIKDIRVPAALGDSATIGHIFSASSIKPGILTAQYLDSMGAERRDYSSPGSRRGNHEVMVCGTFANIRLQGQLLDGVTGGHTRNFTQEGGPQAFIYDAATSCKKTGTPLAVVGGKEYGTGSSRDWATKSTLLLGVKAVVTGSFECIHRSSLIGIGIVPLQSPEGESWKPLGIGGTGTFDIAGLEELNNGSILKTVKVTVIKENDDSFDFDAVVHTDTLGETDYYRRGSTPRCVLRNMVKGS